MRMCIKGEIRFIFREILRGLFSSNTCFEIRPFAVLSMSQYRDRPVCQLLE